MAAKRRRVSGSDDIVLEKGVALPRQDDVGSNRRFCLAQSEDPTGATVLQWLEIAVALVASGPTLPSRFMSGSC
jgi:hypothetical protein